MPSRPRILARVVFFAILLLAIPVGIYHLSSGRPAQATIAFGAALAGVLVAGGWFGSRPLEAPGPAAPAAPTPPAEPPPPRAPAVHGDDVELIETRAPREGWVRNGVVSGLVATAAMTVALLAAYVVVVGLAQRDGGLVGRWFWALANNPLTQAVGAAPMVTLGIQLCLGLAFSVLYAGLAEPHLRGPGWQRGMQFSLLLWLLSIVVFFPAVGAGPLGLWLGAGPLPLLGNLVVHLVYGATLGAVYAIPESAGLDRTTADLSATVRADRGAALGIVVGAILGTLVGLMIEQVAGASPLVAPGGLALGGGVIGGAWGALLGSLAGLGHGEREATGASAGVRL